METSTYYSPHASRPSFNSDTTGQYPSYPNAAASEPSISQPTYYQQSSYQSSTYPIPPSSSAQSTYWPQSSTWETQSSEPSRTGVTATPPYQSTPPPPAFSQPYQPSVTPQPYTPPTYSPGRQSSPSNQPSSKPQIYASLQYQPVNSPPTPPLYDHQHTHTKPLTECPSSKGPDGIFFVTDWYRFRNIPDFHICSHCYDTKISQTQFSPHFEAFRLDPAVHGEAVCHFNTERASRLLDQAIQTNGIVELYRFAQYRATIKSCPGSTKPVTVKDGVRWYGIAEIPEFTCCEACYQDFAAEGPFASCFGSHQLQHRFDGGEEWFCNMAEHFIRRTFVGSVASQDWQAFVGWTRHRMSIPDCDGMKDVQSTSRKWYKPTGIDGMSVCEACYLDYAGNTAVKDKFKDVSSKRHQTATIRCDFAQTSVQLCSAALFDKDPQRWYHLVARIMSAPECANTVQDGEFYTLTNPKTGGQTDFGICERCFLGFVESSGHGNGHSQQIGGLWQKTRFPGLARCDFNPAAARFKKFLAKYAESVLTGCECVLVDYVIKMESLKDCPGSKIVDNHERLWWGMDDFFFCEECYEDIGKDSFFATSFRYQGHRVGHSKCDMHSENMRRKYADACRKQTLTDFTQYCQYRAGVWKELQTLKANQQMTNQHNMYMGMSQLMAANNGKHNAAMWGISNSGSAYNSWYDSSYQQSQWQATQAWNKITGDMVQNSMANSNIEAKWKEVE